MNQRPIATGVTPLNERIPTAAGWSALRCVAGAFQQIVFFNDTQAIPLRIPLSVAQGRVMEWDGTNLWIAEPISQVVGYKCAVHRFTVSGNPPNALTYVESTPFGDYNTNPDALCLDANGGLTFFSHQQPSVPVPGQGWNMVVNVAYRPPGGPWGQIRTINLLNSTTSATSPRSSVCYDPTTRSVVIAYKRDGAQAIDLVRSMAGVPSASIGVITQQANGENGPWGENVCVVLQPDATAGGLRLAYGRNKGALPPPGSSPFVIRCEIGMALLGATTQFTPMQGLMISRLADFGLVLIGGVPTLLFQPVDATLAITGATDQSGLVNGAWTNPQQVDTAVASFANGNWIGYGASLPIFAYVRASTNELIVLSAALNPPQPQPPVAQLMINASGNGAQLAWSAGKALQAQDPSGAWNAVPSGSVTVPVPPAGVNLRVI